MIVVLVDRKTGGLSVAGTVRGTAGGCIGSNNGVCSNLLLLPPLRARPRSSVGGSDEAGREKARDGTDGVFMVGNSCGYSSGKSSVPILALVKSFVRGAISAGTCPSP